MVRNQLQIESGDAICNVYVRAKDVNAKISGTMKLKKSSVEEF